MNKFADFTPDEQDCISRKIPKLKEEGMEQDQAEAVAIKECAPNKSTSQNSLQISPSQQFKVGREHEWQRQSNGRFTIFAVPVFQETHDTREGKDLTYTEKWIKEAAKNHQKFEGQEGGEHAPSVHIAHNEFSGEEKDSVARALNFRSAPLKGPDGKVRETIFVDVHDVRPDTFSKIARGDLPHVSVEIPDPDNPRIGSIAFLSSNAPYFTLPNVTTKDSEKLSVNANTAVCYSATSGENEYVFQVFRGVNDMDNDKGREEKEKKQGEEEEESTQPKDEEGGEKSEIEEIKQRIADLEALIKGETSAPPPVAETESEMEALSAKGKGGESEQFKALEKKIDNLNQKFEDQKQEFQTVKTYTQQQELEKNIADACKRAEDEGRVFSPEKFSNEIRDFAQKFGLDAAEKFVNSKIEDMPIGTGVQTRQHYAYTASQEGVAEKFSAEDPEVYRVAKEAEKDYKKNRSKYGAFYTLSGWVQSKVNQYKWENGIDPDSNQTG